MEIHYKCVVWMQVKFSDEVPDKEQLIKDLETGMHPSNMDFPDAEWNVLYDTEEIFTLEQNKGEATIEIMEPKDNNNGWLQSVWDNSIKNEKR